MQLPVIFLLHTLLYSGTLLLQSQGKQSQYSSYQGYCLFDVV
jgi:hypothetical protein